MIMDSHILISPVDFGSFKTLARDPAKWARGQDPSAELAILRHVHARIVLGLQICFVNT
jgi:hypothetical protein